MREHKKPDHHHNFFSRSRRCFCVRRFGSVPPTAMSVWPVRLALFSREKRDGTGRGGLTGRRLVISIYFSNEKIKIFLSSSNHGGERGKQQVEVLGMCWKLQAVK